VKSQAGRSDTLKEILRDFPRTNLPKFTLEQAVKARRGGERIEVNDSTLSLTSALDGIGWSTPRPATLLPEKRPGTHCTGSI
jgi:hypothetical protein